MMPQAGNESDNGAPIWRHSALTCGADVCRMVIRPDPMFPG